MSNNLNYCYLLAWIDLRWRGSNRLFCHLRCSKNPHSSCHTHPSIHSCPILNCFDHLPVARSGSTIGERVLLSALEPIEKSCRQECWHFSDIFTETLPKLWRTESAARRKKSLEMLRRRNRWNSTSYSATCPFELMYLFFFFFLFINEHSVEMFSLTTNLWNLKWNFKR